MSPRKIAGSRKRSRSVLDIGVNAAGSSTPRRARVSTVLTSFQELRKVFDTILITFSLSATGATLTFIEAHLNSMNGSKKNSARKDTKP